MEESKEKASLDILKQVAALAVGNKIVNEEVDIINVYRALLILKTYITDKQSENDKEAPESAEIKEKPSKNKK